MELSKQQYAQFVKERSKPSPIVTDTIKAYAVGGFICVLGQWFKNFYLSTGMSDSLSSTSVSVTLIAISALLTSLHIFDTIAKFAGAGTLVPITGFANSVVAPAIEFKTEGFITGLAQKMFVIAGPVIVYGTATSFISGLIYYFFLR
jgi:stage V sporulation protein AC